MATRDLWHLGFARLIRQLAPPVFLVRAEVPLSDEPQRADLILIQHKKAEALALVENDLRRFPCNPTLKHPKNDILGKRSAKAPTSPPAPSTRAKPRKR